MPEELEHVLEHLVTSPPAEVEVNVGPVASRRVEEALERQPVAQGIRVGQPEREGHQAVRCGATSDAGNPGPVREAPDALDQEEVGREA